jgi:magnesium transporter
VLRPRCAGTAIARTVPPLTGRNIGLAEVIVAVVAPQDPARRAQLRRPGRAGHHLVRAGLLQAQAELPGEGHQRDERSQIGEYDIGRYRPGVSSTQSASAPTGGFPRMIIDCAHYQDGRRRDAGAMPLDEAAARCGQGGFVWLGLLEPSEAELDQVRETFGLHELAVEDAQTFHMRPKIETYDGGVRLVILRTARYLDDTEEVEFGEISVFLAPDFVITVRQGAASELRGARQRLEQRPELLAAGSSAALWAILDQVVDGYAPVVAGLERDIDQVEATVFSGTVAPTERIYSLRREATDFYRAVHPLLAVTATAERTASDPLQPYLRDVQDHLLLVNEEVAAQRDLLGTILEANMAVISVEQTKVSVRQNSTMERLTVLATVFLPLTFVTGFFGQNFGWLVTNIDGFPAFAAYGLGGLVVPLVLLFFWLRRSAPRTRTGELPP